MPNHTSRRNFEESVRIVKLFHSIAEVFRQCSEMQRSVSQYRYSERTK